MSLRKTAVDKDNRMLRPDELAFFHNNGYLIMRGLIHGLELERLQSDSARLVAEGIAHRGTDHLYRTTFGDESVEKKQTSIGAQKKCGSVNHRIGQPRSIPIF